MQLFKRLIKYRSTGSPELLFVNGYLLVRACRQMLLHKGGSALQEMEAAVAHARQQRKRRARKRARLPADVPGSGAFEGSATALTPEEYDSLMPPYSGVGPVAGLPCVLEMSPELEEEARWPTHPDEADVDKRRAAIVRELGIPCEGEDTWDGLTVHFCKYKRATLASGDGVSCLENRSQPRKDDTWCLVHYLEPDAAGRVRLMPYVARIEFFVQAVIETANGLNCPARLVVAETNADLPDVASDALALAQVMLYHCTLPSTPGLRPPSATRPPEFVCIPDIGEGDGSSRPSSFNGRWLVLLGQLDCQLIPMKPQGKSRYFMSQNKSSGRSRAIRSTAKPVPLVA